MPPKSKDRVKHEHYPEKSLFHISGQIDEEVCDDELKMSSVQFCGIKEQYFSNMRVFPALNPYIAQNMRNMKRQEPWTPTTIQRLMLPYLFETDCDLVLSAKIGTGKTTGYLIALLDIISRYRKEEELIPPEYGIKNEPFAVLILPTSYAVKEVVSLAHRLSDSTGIRICFGLKGSNPNEEDKKLKSDGCDLYIGTIGKLTHNFASENNSSPPILSTRRLKFVVMDGMPSSKFTSLKTFMNIVRANTTECRVVVASNEKPSFKSVNLVVRRECINVEINNLHSLDKIEQQFVEIREQEKSKYLSDLYINKNIRTKVIIFVNGSETGKRLLDELSISINCHQYGSYLFGLFYNASSLETIDYAEQMKRLDKFREGSLTTLIVVGGDALRNLNIPDVETVVNYDFPSSAEEYICQIGCCGRIYCKGHSITFIDPTESNKNVRDILDVCAKSGAHDAVNILERFADY